MNDASYLDARRRPADFESLERQTFDLLVIGGGVTGAGIARDAALRGLAVALVEARDFASGTSSRSSKMIHGGLRYLPQGHIALVRQAALERQVLRRIAPHLARPDRYVIPTASRRALNRLRVALWLYEKLGRVPANERHVLLRRAELADREPLLRSARLSGGLEYTEFLTDDARLVLANLRSARAAGATILNYVQVEGLLHEQARVAGALVRATLPGESRQARVRARLVVSAAGVWVDAVRALDSTDQEKRITVSRGIHLVVHRERLPVRSTVVLPTRDRRMTFAVPRGRFTYVGTTDVFHDGLEYWPRFDRDDVDYLLAAVRDNLDTAPIQDDEIVALWSGVRPLIAQPGRKSNEISRKDEIWTSPGGLVSIAGGKLSAYRAMAEHVVDNCVTRLGKAALPCSTAGQPLVGGERSLGSEEVARLAAEAAVAERLANLYGTEATQIVAGGGDVAAEARHAVLAEGALTLEDYWVRRSARAWFDDRAGLGALQPAARAMGALLGWDDAACERQVRHCLELERASRAPLRTARTTT